MIAVRTEDARGAVEARFEYDPLGRRTAKSETYFDVRGVELRKARKRFVWEGLRLAQEIRETGVSSYAYSPDAPYSPVARVDAVIADAVAAVAIEQARHAARIYHFHTDLVGAPLEVTDEAGQVAWAGRYAAWGKVEAGDRELVAPRTEQPLRYAGQYADDSTGLHYNTFRFYDPDVGRFVNQDPIGVLGGENLYSYAPNSVRWSDPVGWFCGASQKHHPIPKFLGGNEKQNLIALAKDPHVDFHGALNKRLMDLFGMRGGGRGGGAADWAVEMANTPGMQKEALDAVLDAARSVDATHGTNLTSAVWENIVNGNFKVYP